jgi:hypothetical protein
MKLTGDREMKAANVPVMVTTAHKGVFFGYVPKTQPRDAKSIALTKCRMCVYWSSDMKGVTGLAVVGPSDDCRIGPAVSKVTVHDVTAIFEVEPAAAKQWEASKWAR